MIVRKDYNKPNRCPAWSGSGMNVQYPWERKLPSCPSGQSGYYVDGMKRGYRRAGWAFHVCLYCGTKTWPYALRLIDPLYLVGMATKWRIG